MLNFEFYCDAILKNIFIEYDSLAQPVEHLTFNQGATGSNPVRVTNSKSHKTI